ncbi:MAG: hypothetical protein HKP37_09675 [Boseongicola sp.]|nr:hypothetical protein [Boseongicola sp.]NNL18994.1 hypothetical protein [Boseongicola sp.]
MADTLTHIETLRRPRLLIRAARHGLTNYSRERTLSRLLTTPQKTADGVLSDLMRTEAEIEATRKNGDVAYSVTRHLEVLIALMGEARLMLSRSRAPEGI